MYVFKAGMSIFRLGGKGKGMHLKNEKIGGLNWKNVGKNGGIMNMERRISNVEVERVIVLSHNND